MAHTPAPAPTTPVWNVYVPVVELVAANTAEEAVEKVAKALAAAGFNAHEEDRDAFESEPVDPAHLFTGPRRR